METMKMLKYTGNMRKNFTDQVNGVISCSSHSNKHPENIWYKINVLQIDLL